jgi:hypothetical protein
MDFSTYSCNDGGYYFCRREIDTGESGRCAWFGYHPDGSWANVFWGRWVLDGQVIDGMRGDWCDVPFGSATGSGEIALRFEPGAPPPDWHRVDATGGFSGSAWNRSSSSRLPDSLPSGVRDFSAESISGVWQTDTGARYYVRELPAAEPGHAPNIFWYAVRPDHSAVHVARGTRRDDVVIVQWMDIPPSGVRYLGTRLELEVVAADRMEKRAQSHNFGSSEWTRLRP